MSGNYIALDSAIAWAEPSRPQKILLIDDHPLFIAGVGHILRDLLGAVELLHAVTAAAAKTAVHEHTDLDWLFCDYKLPDANGLALLREFKRALLPAPVIMVSAFDDIALIDEALQLGASGFIPKSADKSIFQQCLRSIEHGEVFLPAELRRQLVQYREVTASEKKCVASSLSPRQHDVLLLLANGYSNQEIGAALGISESTVKSHVSALLTLLDTDNRVQCVAEARRLQLVT